MGMIAEDIFSLVSRLNVITESCKTRDITASISAIEKAAEKASKSWSGSWLGYHSTVYYAGLQQPPPGARFSKEWGLKNLTFIQETIGEWVEYNFDQVYEAIQEMAGNPDLEPVKEVAKKASEIFEDCRHEILSLLSTWLDKNDDSFVSKMKEEIEKAQLFSASDFINVYRPTGQFISRDMSALNQGLRTPPHIALVVEMLGLRAPVKACEDLEKIARRAASHIAKKERCSMKNSEIGTNVFIGHGRSHLWKDLKDFIKDRLNLPWDEFNRVPVAGVTNIARLSQMLNDAAIAFLVMTAEDELADGKVNARMNVIHEAGLFQGKLGFSKAIILLEDGCEEFSNIQGLGQIRFSKDNIKAVFEEVRLVLEREGLIET